MKIDKDDGLLDGIEDDAPAEVPMGLIGSILLLEVAALLAAALVRWGVL